MDKPLFDKFCRHCGNEHPPHDAAILCEVCNHHTWINPLPVAVWAQPVHDKRTGEFGILIGNRLIEPHVGKWNLIGGFMEVTDLSVEAGAAREFFEETGIAVNPEGHVFHTYGSGRAILSFVLGHTVMDMEEIEASFVPNSECDQVRMVTTPETLCFISHTQALKKALEIILEP